MTSVDGQREASGSAEAKGRASKLAGVWLRLRSRVRYGVSLRVKLVLPVLAIACLAVGLLFVFAYFSLQSSIESIYEARARSVAAVISKSIQEKDYILYYSDELDADIARLLEQYESILGITVIGATARGFVTVASTDPTCVGVAANGEESQRYESLRGVEASRARTSAGGVLRAMHPIGSVTQRAGVVIVDMSLAEQVGTERRLAWQFGAAAATGVLILCGLLGLVLSIVVTRPVGRIAAAAQAVARRDYSLAPALSPHRVPGTPVRDELCQLADGFELMTARICSHEQELRKLVLLDELTGLYNADHFREQLPIELGKGKRYGHPTSLLIVDLAGLTGAMPEEEDRLRVRAASHLLSSLRRVDTVYRVARDRFVGILPETPAAGAGIAAERVRAYAADVTASCTFPATLSVAAMGWAPDDDVPLAELVRRLTEEEGGSAA